MKRYLLTIGTAALAIFVAQQAAQASLTTLTPGSGGSIGTTSDSTALGTATLVSPFSNGPQQGSLSTWVLSGDAANPYGSSDLVFVYQVTETATPPDDIATLALNGFGGLASIAVGYAGSGVAPYGANLEPNGVVNFSFGGIPSSGVISDYLYVYTSATASTPSVANVIDSTTASPSSLSPAAVPEPATVVAGVLMLLPLGIGAVRSLRRERAA
jgi:hypothetical protein